jgi:hypothetical protein
MLPATNNLVSKMVKSLQQKLTVGAALGKFFQYLRTQFSHIALFADAPSFAKRPNSATCQPFHGVVAETQKPAARFNINTLFSVS